MTGNQSGDTTSEARKARSTTHSTAPGELCGSVWSRTLLVTPAGVRDETTEVTWVQGRDLYCDLRQPTPGVVDGQEGFAGRFAADRDVVTWHHDIDLTPGGPADVATFTRLDDTTVAEHGVHEHYTEHWRLVHHGDVDEYLLGDPAGGLGVLVRVGERFGYAHHRPGSLGSEVMTGRLTDDRWQVETASRTDRVGVDLAVVVAPTTVTLRLDGECLVWSPSTATASPAVPMTKEYV